MATVDAERAPGAWPVWRALLLAARPRTLPVAVAPVAVASALAWTHGRGRALPAVAALAGALLLQIAANFANDLYDFEKGADGPDRIGPPRAVQLGLLSPREMRAALGAVLGAVLLVGLYLVARGGWPIVAVGLASIAAAVAYTGGPWPLGYHGLGELAVFLFFGVVAVCGTYYVQALEVSPQALALSLPIGALASAILVVNNVRDIESDRRAGKRTLAVRAGRHAAVRGYAALVLAPYALLPALRLLGLAPAGSLFPLLSLPLALRLVRDVAAETRGPELSDALAGTARLLLGFALLLAVGCLVGIG